MPGESRRPVNLEIRETMQVRGLFFLKGDELPEIARFQPSNDVFFWTRKTCEGILTWNKGYIQETSRDYFACENIAKMQSFPTPWM